MTTTVIIKSPSPNHLDVLVRILNGVTISQEIRLREGEETMQYVHTGCKLIIEEVEKEKTNG